MLFIGQPSPSSQHTLLLAISCLDPFYVGNFCTLDLLQRFCSPESVDLNDNNYVRNKSSVEEPNPEKHNCNNNNENNNRVRLLFFIQLNIAT